MLMSGGEFSMELSFSDIDEFEKRWRSVVLGCGHTISCLANVHVETSSRTCSIVGSDERSKGTSFGELCLLQCQYGSKARCSCGNHRLEARRKVAALRSLLSEAEMEVLVLSCVEELSAREIGQVIGRSERAVHSILHRAKAKARERLVGDE